MYVCPTPTELEMKTVKGAVSRDGYFLEGLNILIGTFCVCADGCQCLSKAFHYPILYRTNGVIIFIDYCTAPRDT
jgi:hypothetical protein